MSPLPKRALIAVTSAKAPLGEGNTGVFITEALHPYNVFRAAGFEVDIASEEGKWSPDALSLTNDFLNGEDRKQYEDPNSEFMKEMNANKKAKDMDASKYGIFFASAGHAALIDFPHAKSLQSIASSVYQAGGVASSVCHGPAIFTHVVDSEGKPIIAGKKIAGFTLKGEEELGVMDTIRSWNAPIVSEHAETLGATYVESEGAWDDFNVVDGRVVTGQNPQSATSTAKAVVDVFGKL